MIWANRLEQFIDGHGLVAGLEKFLKLPLRVGLFGDLFGLGNTVSVNGGGPSSSGLVTRVQKNRSEDGFPNIRQGSGRFVDLLPGRIDPDPQKGREPQFPPQLGKSVAVG